ncbi:hypothetical protein [Candidatus Neptunichlamydia sp. REUL1]|uniref:hypothetical protein n=1 Tax=Candidatus Neptunichlamydia sp. REUL1 TaxID=3064277 RepID=UPI00292D75EE|nr:hypothetical protein [Candidatus Neptunochlamydia sp. REUL1]
MLTEILKSYPKRKVIEVLQEFLTEERVRGIDKVLSKRIHGVQVGIEAPYDLLFRVPMFGIVESLNLSVAAEITLYDYLKRKREEMGEDGDLSEEELLEEKARFYVRSLGLEQSIEILKRRLL